jgi:hypothetical protein
MKYQYSKTSLEKIVNESYSIAEVCRKLNIRPVGGNYKTLKSKFNLFNIDISHFTGKAWNQGKNFITFSKKHKTDDILVVNSAFTSSNKLRIRLIKENLKQPKCEICDIAEW